MMGDSGWVTQSTFTQVICYSVLSSAKSEINGIDNNNNKNLLNISMCNGIGVNVMTPSLNRSCIDSTLELKKLKFNHRNIDRR